MALFIQVRVLTWVPHSDCGMIKVHMANIQLIRASNGGGEAVRGSVTAQRSPGATTLTVDSIVNWPSQFIATTGVRLPDGTLDPATAFVFEGHLSGSAIEIDTIAPGYTDDGNSVSDVVLVKPTTHWADTVADVLSAAHTNEGYLKTAENAGFLVSTAATEPAPDPDGRIILWFEPL